MVIFIDESGTHKQSGHSTSAVVYVEVKNLERFEKELKEIEEDLRISFFHWAEERWFMKNKFLSRIFDLDFTVKVALFENPVNPNIILEIVFQHLIVEKEINSIFIDGEKPKWYERNLKKVLRDKGIAIKKLRTVRSRSEVGIQLADCLASLVRYYHDNPEEKDAKKWFNKLKREKKLVFELTVNPGAFLKKTSPEG
ncbi:DUF3800 domain-containing protein [Candidatus Daviesbacteria bacterium]|nr:DUF3800 domain-containing protein [Candidatus Daviesbacteria bacterium]MBI4036135.1 DUF3800 domain-containing protein [Candidatus Daviesbacteria bacterium]